MGYGLTLNVLGNGDVQGCDLVHELLAQFGGWAMRTDLLQPQPGTGSQEAEVRLREVRLLNLSPLWLPEDVVVTRSTKGNAVREKHEFSSWKRSILEFKSPPATEHPTEKQK